MEPWAAAQKASVAVPSAPVRVPSQMPLAPSVDELMRVVMTVTIAIRGGDLTFDVMQWFRFAIGLF